ncbi:TonB-dependent receptor [Idiomarina xiamenensis]|uniref:TonB-dependent receptor n=1 Tax=Idiomarina xiamenensis 10-D-4 TaxID=740709 RepID=K2KPT9_9GAMM|nr:TonB-dependent receptor [Idiomarina xiamenensis]EKE84484.1 TonB-dependent receptor [Idiomarina xiamenensis 10-D-4]
MYKNLITLSVLSLSFSSWANDVNSVKADDAAMEVIEVTADFRTRSIDATPASVSALSKADIERRSASYLDEMLNAAANVNFAGGASRGRFIQIRGIGERSQFVDPINPSVGLIIDGINYSGLGAAATLFDIGQVELFRGPQSGRFGADAMAGMIVMNSVAPSDDVRGQWLFDIGNYNKRMAGFAVGGDLAALGRGRVSLSQLNSDGFTYNDYLQTDDTESRDEMTVKLALDSDLGQHWQLQSRYHHIDVNNGYDAFSLENNRHTLSDEPGYDRLQSDALRLQLNYTGWQHSRIELSSTWLQADTAYAFDEDWTYVGIAPGWEYSSFDAYERDRDDATFELRWLSQQPIELFGIPSDWVIGVYHYRRDVDLLRDYFNYDRDEATIFTSDYQSRSSAIYAEWQQHWRDDLTVTWGIRGERYDNDYIDSNAVIANPSDTMWGGRLSVNYQVRPQTYIYTTLARGYKNGGVNGEALGRAKDQALTELEDYLLARATFKPELLWNAEFGVKGRSEDQRLTVRVSSFYSWRDDVQLKSWVNREQSFVGYIENAASGDNYGLEAEVGYQVSDNWRLFASAGWLQTKIDGFVTEDGVDMSGRDQAQAPNYQFNLGSDYWFNEAWQLQLEVDGKDGFYFSDSHNQKADSMLLLHARINYHIGDWTLTAYGRNLTDEDYAIRGFYFGNDPRDEYVTETYKQYGEPRRFGISASYQF